MTKKTFEAETTFELCVSKLDDTHKSIAVQMEHKMLEQGADLDSPEAKSEGMRMTDSLALISVLGHEIDKLKMRIVVLEMAADGEHATN